jgi:ABC-type multidrug transport system fused ATPase/permease subunit
MRVIRELSKSKIIILISHRLANVTGANRIYFLCEGQICESGSHTQLMEKNGKYAELFAKQQKLEEINTNEKCL